jgi:hypothetical protein
MHVCVCVMQPDIRINVLEHNLKPKPEDDRAMVVVDGKMTLDRKWSPQRLQHKTCSRNTRLVAATQDL